MKDILKRINELIEPFYQLVEVMRTPDYAVISTLLQDEPIHLYYVVALHKPFIKELSKLLTALVADGTLTEAQVKQLIRL